MSDGTLSLESRVTKPSEKHDVSTSELGSKIQIIDTGPFFEAYSQIPAFTKILKKPNEAVELFHSSKLDLESLLERNLALEEKADEQKTEQIGSPIATCHSLLSLIYWLYPDYRDFNRAKNANAMYRHAIDATDYSQTPFSMSYILGLFIQLRILPYMIRSNKPLTKELAKIREKALLLISLLDSASTAQVTVQAKVSLFKGVLNEGIGFSYWQLERDSQTALGHLQKSVENLVEASDSIQKSHERVNSGSEHEKKRKNGKVFGSHQGPELSFCLAFTAVSYWDLGHCHEGLADKLEGDDRMRLIRKARADYEKSYSFAKKTTWNNYKGLGAYMIASTYEWEAERETEKKEIKKLLKKAISIGNEALRWLSLWSTYESDFLAGSWIAAYYGRLADYSEPRLRRRYMLHSLKLAKRAEELITEHESRPGGKLFTAAQIGDLFLRNCDYYRQLATNQKATLNYSSVRTRKERTLVVESLKKSLDYAIRGRAYYKEERFNKQAVHSCLLVADVCHELLGCDVSEEDKKNFILVAKKNCQDAQAISKRNDWNESVAESDWLLAQVLDLEGKYAQSAICYLKACKHYERAKSVSEHGTKVYQDFADYMLAWNEIELAKLAHISSEFDKAAVLYFKAGHLMSKTREWSKGSQLFLAESLIELGESKSLQEESASDSIEQFDEAISSLSKFAEETKDDLSSDSSYSGLAALAQNLITFCRARIILEKSKEAYRVGDFEKSISGLTNAETMFEDLASNPVISDSLRSNELRSMASLCRALASFQKAQMNNDPELYLEARRIFGEAAEESKSKALRPLLSGLASFASFLFYSNQVEGSLGTGLELDQVIECNKALESAESNFRRVGNKSFLNILKASKHILDASIKMSSAEREVEHVQVKAKLYAEAQRSLSLASKYYKLVGSSKRLKEALRMISAVRNHQRLIPLAHDIIAEIASSQIFHAAISSSSVMEQAHQSSSSRLGVSYVGLDCEIDKAYTQVDENSKISLVISNLGREYITATRIDEALPEGFEITECPVGKLIGHSLKLNLRLEAGESKSFAVSYIPRSAGEFSWHPSLIFLDAKRNFKIATSRITRSVVEPNKENNFATLLGSKSSLESTLEILKRRSDELQSKAETDPELVAQQSRLTEEIYAVREKISHIEEEFLRTKNEYNLMVAELERVRTDIQILKQQSVNTSEASVADPDDSANLIAEEKLLEARVERRRLLLEQAQLL